MPQAMTQHSPGSLDQWLYFLTQRTVPNLYQIHFFIFCVNKGFRFMLVYSCLHYLLFSPVSTKKQDRKSGVVSHCWTEIPYQNMIMNLNILAATIRSFKMLIDYTLDLTPPPPSPLAPNPSLKRKRRRRNFFKIPTCTGPCCHCKHPKQILSSALGNKLPLFWLGSVSF